LGAVSLPLPAGRLAAAPAGVPGVVADDDGAGAAAGAGADDDGVDEDDPDAGAAAGGVAGVDEAGDDGGAPGVSALLQPARASAPTREAAKSGARNDRRGFLVWGKFMVTSGRVARLREEPPEQR
jgi:hypothetical protein